MLRKLASIVGFVVVSSSIGCDQGMEVEHELDAAGDDEIGDRSGSSPIAPLSLFVMGNAADGNEVLAYRRVSSGRPVLVGSFPTGGQGTGSGLGSQGSVILDETGQWLFVVNAGSDEISAFEVTQSHLVLRDIVPSGGDRPVSLTVHGDVLYVLNAGDSMAVPATASSITGFTVDEGQLTPIAGSTRPLSTDDASPAQVGFSPDGSTLVVTERATQSLTSFAVDVQGLAGQPVVTASSGMTPFGFEFADDDTFVVAEAFGGAAGASAASSYRLEDGVPVLVSGSVPTQQTSACWVAISKNGHYAYTANTAGDSITGFDLAADGTLASFGDGGATALPGDGPADVAASGDGRFLYVVNGQTDSIGVIRIGLDGSLTVIADVPGLPSSGVGIAAR
jgi:6-phosphogluconolactonase